MKKYKNFLFITLGLVVVVLFLVFYPRSEQEAEKGDKTAETMKHEKEILYYTCGMHPSVRINPEDFEAGNKNCPICNMECIPVYKEAKSMEAGGQEEHGEHEKEEAQIRLSPRAQTLAGVKSEAIGFLPLFKEINTVGQMDFDERRMASVAAWISGRVDKLFVNFTGVEVKKGAPLVLIYSPELVTTQEEYLLAIETLEKVKQSRNEETIEGAQSLVRAAKRRLLLWGISEQQINELMQKKETSTHMTIQAPIGGTVIQKNVIEGQYVKEGENLYQIADLSHLWALGNVYEYEMIWVKPGQTVKLRSTAYSGEEFEGKISFIDPYLDPKTRSVKVRVDVPNPQNRLKPGMYVNVAINSQILEGIRGSEKPVYICPMCPEVVSDKPASCPECGMDLVKKGAAPSGAILAVPKEAVLDTGLKKLVYIEKEKGMYVAREVEIGPEATAFIDGTKQRFYVIQAGLSEGMKVVTQANFLIDSQSQITGQAEAIYSGALERNEKDKKKTPPAKHIH